MKTLCIKNYSFKNIFEIINSTYNIKPINFMPIECFNT